MNERICELKEAAMEVIFSSPSTGREQKQLNVDKFAELIVRECVLHLHRRGVEGFDILEERNLKEHFGIE